MIYTVLNKQDFEQELADAGNNLVVIDFYANWCGPCKTIDPHLQELSSQYADKAKFLKVNVDDCEDISIDYNITSMPTFVFMKDQQIIDILVGSNADKLENNIEKHVNGAQATLRKSFKSDDQLDMDSIQDDDTVEPELDEDEFQDMLEFVVDYQM